MWAWRERLVGDGLIYYDRLCRWLARLCRPDSQEGDTFRRNWRPLGAHKGNFSSQCLRPLRALIVETQHSRVHIGGLINFINSLIIFGITTCSHSGWNSFVTSQKTTRSSMFQFCVFCCCCRRCNMGNCITSTSIVIDFVTVKSARWVIAIFSYFVSSWK